VDDQDEWKKQQEDQGMDHKGFSRGNGGDILDKSNLVKMRNGIVVGFVTQTSIYTRKNKKSFRFNIQISIYVTHCTYALSAHGNPLGN